MGVAATGLQVTAILGRQEVGDQALNNAEAVFRKLEIADYLWIEEGYGVCGDRVAESGMEFLRDCGTAYDAASFQDRHLESARSKIGGADEAVMPATDDQRIGLRG
jgi:hypothetical protein